MGRTASIGQENFEYLMECRQRLELAKQAVISVGYFVPDEVGDDVAPRILELIEAIREGKFLLRRADT